MFTTPLSSAPGDLVSPALAGQVGQSGPLSGLDPQQPYSPAAPLTRPPGLDPDGPTFPSPRKLVAEGLDPTEVGTQNTKPLFCLSCDGLCGLGFFLPPVERPSTNPR
jgi:hypothetical protein